MILESARLVRPDIVYRDTFLDALREYIAEDRNLGIHRPGGDEAFDDFVSRLRGMKEPALVEPGFVPQTVFWLVDGSTYVGRLSLRHRLNEQLRLIGGHIGYDIRSSMRRQGYGTRALALGLNEARKVGLSRVLLTCNQDNTGSRRVIERNGGVLEDEITLPDIDGVIRRYWITL